MTSNSSSSSKPYDYQYKILIVGDSAVGKTSILTRFVDEAFYGNYLATIGIDYKIKNIELDGKKIRLQIWDTAGQERFRTITGAYFRKAMGIVLVYDVTSQRTFDSITKWLESIQKNAPEDTKLLIVGNKCEMDAERQVSIEKAKDLGRKYEIDVLEISAKENINVEETFMDLTMLIKGNKKQASSSSTSVTSETTENTSQANSNVAQKSRESENIKLSGADIRVHPNKKNSEKPSCGQKCN